MGKVCDWQNNDGTCNLDSDRDRRRPILDIGGKCTAPNEERAGRCVNEFAEGGSGYLPSKFIGWLRPKRNG